MIPYFFILIHPIQVKNIFLFIECLPVLIIENGEVMNENTIKTAQIILLGSLKQSQAEPIVGQPETLN